MQLDFSRFTYGDDGNVQGLWMANRVSLETVTKYLWLPSLRRIQALSICFSLGPDCQQQILDNIQRLNSASSVSDLRFLDCCTWELSCDSLLAGFILSAQRLRRFVFESNGRVPFAEGFEGLGHALRAHLATLEEIVLAELSTDFFTGWAMGSFRDFRSLKRLATPIYTKLVDGLATEIGFETFPSIHRYIPPQLEELQVQFLVDTQEPGPVVYWPVDLPHAEIKAKTNYREGFLKLWELTRTKIAYVPSLKKVTWWFQQYSQELGHHSEVPAEESLHQMNELKTAFAKVGVEFEWLATPLFGNTPSGQRVYEW